MLDVKNLNPGKEQYEGYTDRILKKKLVQYDYRHTDGELFSCVRSTLERCQIAKEKWIGNKEA